MTLTIWFLCLTLNLQPGHVSRVIDGDTFVLYHVGTPPEERVRVLGVDTPERGDLEFDHARLITQAWLALGPFQIVACKRDSFGRLLATVRRNTESLAEVLILTGAGKRDPP